MAFVFKPDPAGIAELLREYPVDDLEARAQRVASAASDGDAEYGVRSEQGGRRPRAAVVTENYAAMLTEAREHRLATAIEHAR